jgi:hypothetical protein
MPSVMGVTFVCLYHHIISVTNSRTVVMGHHLQLLVVRLLISLMIPSTLLLHPEVHCHPLVLPVQGNSK